MADWQYNEDTEVSYINKTRQVIDAETGEISYETDIYKKMYGQDQFYKLYLFDMLNALGMFSTSKQLDVLLYVLKNTDSNNLFIGTYRYIAEQTNVSYLTVQRAIANLIKANIIQLHQQGVYRVNPSLIMKGNNIKKGKLTLQYQVLENKNKHEEVDENQMTLEDLAENKESSSKEEPIDSGL